MFRLGKIRLVLILLAAMSVAAVAQTTNPPAQTAQPPQPSDQAQPADQLLKPEQLEALVAPIALYPDALLANVLAASSYPLEVVQADRWLRARKNLKGDTLKAEVDKQSWDDSVKALASTAAVLSMMSDKLDWTKSLGDAVLAQQADVMDAIQRLRGKAQANNKLVTTKQQKVSVQTQENKQVIVIEQTDPGTMYVPYYEPATVYGAWPYAEYPPYYFGYPSYIGAGVIAAGIAFGTAWAIGRWGNYWGGGCNWGNRNLYVNNFNRTTNIGNSWQHNSAHRQGVRYSNTNVQQRFGNNNLKAGAGNRMDFRGRDGQQVLRPGQERPGGGDRVGTGNRGGTGDRIGAGDRGGDRVSSRDRPGGERANRPSSADRGKGGGGGNRATTADRSRNATRGGGGRDNAFRNVSSGRAASVASARGQMSMAGRGGGFAGGGGGFRGGGGGGFRGGGGGGGFRGGGGGRRSDIALKHDIVLLGHLANGLGYYRFSYLGSNKAYVGVMAQEVAQVIPQAVTRGSDGFLRVYYDKLGLKFSTYSEWLAAGAQVPAGSEVSR
ncbi:hypothetical protein AS156_29005 [Bradyrhizobium macuxiense]|uniref:Peptidase S74 domain-containing protein n=1 Tax=Bradyrhizobium macuxiense TaxID=1755647 RepID=A0A109K4D5_9BRAD|nr:DUF3300 domain-containing protein [Bradyrhizobium macuxiense]KWV60513.1 hypothetical protein AS156_29005 [Bradyrhizobium macuxiense]